ncbi:DUF6353 family protein [Fibrobacter sp.]|uniref:DUF6353 family protein n=1 Tax=Fibrobacter sp. TaxID=35828 RepID=UPI00388E06EA
MSNLLHVSKKFVKRNASTILTCMGGAGVVATSVMSVKATPKALEILELAEQEKGESLTRLEKVKVAGPTYIPSVVMGAATIACIFGANVLSKQQQAALMSAYAMIDSSYKEYREKVKELYGEEGDNNVRTEIAKDNYDEKEVTDLGGEELFFDEFSLRYFKSTLYKVQHAQYELNRDLIMQEWVTLNDYYRYLGIPGVEGGDEVGWSTCYNFDAYWQIWIDFSHNMFEMADGTECHRIGFFHEPYVDFEDPYGDA